MAIKIQGSTIIDDSRVIVNADKIGIGQDTPTYDLEIFSGSTPTGIAVSATSTQSDDTNKAISVFNNTDDTTFSVSFKGRVDALEYHGTFKGDIDPSVGLITSVIKQGNTKAEVVDTNGDGHFFVQTENEERLRITPSGQVGIGSTIPDAVLDVVGNSVVASFSSLNNDYVLRIRGDNATNKVFFGATNANDFLLANGDGGAGTVERLRITSTGNVGIGTQVPTDVMHPANNAKLAVGIVTANEYWGTFYGTIDTGVGLAANTIKTVTSTSGATHYLTFVDSNNTTATSESVYTDGGITYQPDVNRLGIGTIKPGQILDSSDDSGTLNYVIKADGEGGWAWGQIEGGSVGAVNFTDLNDTPANYTGHAHKFVRVNKDGSTNNGTALEFVESTNVGKTYTLDAVDSGDNVKLRLSDGTTDDDVLITAGTGISLDSVGAGGFTINASASGAGSLTDLDVKQFSGHHGSTPRTERSCSNPIDVTVDSTAGIATIGIGSTSNAFGRRYIQDTEPSTDVCEGDIWFDTSTTTSTVEIDKVAILRDEKSAGTYGGRVGSGDYTGKRAYWNGVNAVLDVWFPRVLNTKYDPSNIVTSFGNGVESGNQYSNTFALDSGTYKINWRAPGHQVDRFQTRLAYNTNADFSGTTSYYYGTSQYSGVDPSVSGGGGTSNSADESEGEFVLTISATTYFRIEQWIYATGQSGAFGDGALGVAISRNTANNTNLNLGNTEVYTQVKIEDLSTAVKEGSGSGSGSGNSSIISLNGTSQAEFTNIPSWATKITLIGENVVLPEPSGGTGNKIGEILEFGGNSGYLNYPAYMNLTSFISRDTPNTGSSAGISEYDNSPYAPYILLNASSVGSGPVLSQVFFTFVKVKDQNKWVYEGSVGNRKGYLDNNNEDFKFLNEFTGSFTATEAITKLKFYSYEGTTPSFTYGLNFTGGTLTAIFESGGGSSGGGSSSVQDKIQEGNTKAEVVDTGTDGHFLVETEAIERLRITSSGDVGIGTTQPADKFQVGIGTTSFNITSDGKVGIGTTIPTNPIGIQSSTTLAVAGIVTALQYYGDGSNLTGVTGSGGGVIVLLPEQASSSGTEVEFTKIPADAQEITVMFKGVSALGQGDFKIQLGTASAYITSNYDSLSQNEGGGDERNATDCFLIRSDGGNRTRTGSMIIKKASSTSYVQTGQFAVKNPASDDGGTQTYGSLSSVSGIVDRLKITLSSSDTFDAGTISVSYKTGGGSATTGSILGQVVSWAGNINNIPSEYVLCDGRELDKTTYSDLFDLLGTIHNVGGEPSNVFRVPDLRDKFIVGAHSDSIGTTYPQLQPAATGGAANGSLPSHYHNMPGDDQLTFANGQTGGTQNGVQATWSNTYDNSFSYDATSTNTGSGRLWRTTTVGSSTLNSNLPPYYALAYIINVTGKTLSVLATSKVAVLKDQKNATISSGAGTAGGWTDRDITVKNDPSNFVTLNAIPGGESNASSATRRSGTNGISYFALAAGTYKIKFRATGYYVSQHQAAMAYSSTESNINKVFSTSDTVNVIYGTSETSTNSSTTSDSTGLEVITLNQTTYFKVIHYITSTFSTSDFGQSSSPGKNVYLTIEIEDLATAVKAQGTTNPPVAVIKHVETTGTNGGAATVAKTGWNTRKLNDLNDSGAGATLDTTLNIFALPAGTYKIDFSTPFYHTSGSQSRLKYSNQSDVVSGTLSYIIGSSLYAGPGSGGETVGESDGHDVIVLTETNYFILESKVAVAQGAYDFGVASNYNGDFSGTTATQEVYSQVVIMKL